MAEEMTFLPKADLLTLEELDVMCRRFMAAGVRKIRLTGVSRLSDETSCSLSKALAAR